MPPRKCHLCFEDIDEAWAEVTFHGFTTLALNGVTFVVHARCLRLEPMERGIPLAERLSDPVAEPVEPVPDWVPNPRDPGGWNRHNYRRNRLTSGIALRPSTADTEGAA